MRPVYLVALLGVLALTGCSDRPNDLDTYYDDPPPEPVAQAPAPKASGQGKPLTTTTAEPAPRDLVRAVLTDGDVAEEGVRRLPGNTPDASRCVAVVQDGAGQRHARQWVYPTGSRLRQYVAELPAGAGAAVRAANCAGRPFELAAPGVESHRAWCEPAHADGHTCAVILVRDRVTSAVLVSAQDLDRAREAVIRLAPVAAALVSGDER